MKAARPENREVHMNTNTWTCLNGDTTEEDLSEGKMREEGQRVGNEQEWVKQLEEKTSQKSYRDGEKQEEGGQKEHYKRSSS